MTKAMRQNLTQGSSDKAMPEPCANAWLKLNERYNKVRVTTQLERGSANRGFLPRLAHSEKVYRELGFGGEDSYFYKLRNRPLEKVALIVLNLKIRATKLPLSHAKDTASANADLLARPNSPLNHRHSSRCRLAKAGRNDPI